MSDRADTVAGVTLDAALPIKNAAAPRVAVYRDIAALPESARALLVEAGRDNLCLGLDWFMLLQRHSAPADRLLRLYAVGGADHAKIDCLLVAWAGPRTLWHRRHLASATNFYTMSFAPLLRRDLQDPRGPIEALVRFIAAERPAWAVVELRSLVAEEPVTRLLSEAFGRHAMRVHQYFQFENWFVPTQGVTAKDYFDTRPSRLKNTVNRKAKKLAKEHKVGFRLFDNPTDIEQGIADYEHVYARSWKRPELYPDFVPNLIRTSAARNALRLGVYYIDDIAAAAQIWLLAGEKAIIYKLAYDEAHAATSAGSILTKLMFDHVLNYDKVREVDYGVGSEPYKLDWMSDRRHIVGLVAYNLRSVAGLLAAGTHIAGELLRPLRRATKARSGPEPETPAKL